MKNISSTTIAVVSSDQMRRLERIDSEDYSLVMEKALDDLTKLGIQVSDDYGERGIYALKQYYAVALLDPANAHAVTVPVDPFWHSHILFTAQYREFCDDVVGQYMDHVPLNHRDSQKVDNVRELYGYTLEVLPRLFSDVDEAFWPVAVSDEELICFHFGNTITYPQVQAARLFEPVARGRPWAYS